MDFYAANSDNIKLKFPDNLSVPSSEVIKPKEIHHVVTILKHGGNSNFNILNFLDRLAQIREGGIQATILQQYLTSHQHNSVYNPPAIHELTSTQFSLKSASNT